MALETHGRVLVDIPALGLVSGEYSTLPSDVAKAYEAIGYFDSCAKKDAGQEGAEVQAEQAEQVEQAQQPKKRGRKPQ